MLLSGLQHFEFCQRQWALIHIEQQWAENLLTVEGNIFHENAHNKFFTESRGDIIISRGMPVYSAELGVSGECDVVEFHKRENGIELYGKSGKYQPYPIEYKKGKPKEGSEDVLQLVCQAMCLEEMLCCDNLKLMHQYYKRKYTPNTKPDKRCNACSIKDICLPKRNKYKSVGDYISKSLEGEV